jgi:excisionase family DNA binding protein
MTEATDFAWTPDVPLLLDRRQAAALLNISVGTVANLVRHGELSVCRIGSRVLFRRSTLEVFVKRSHETESREAKEERRQRRPKTSQ